MDVTEKTYTGDIIRAEMPNFQSREQVTIGSGAGSLTAGSVLGQKLLAGTAISAAKSGGNTGTGANTMDVTTPLLAGGQAGVYKVRCITTATNGGVFEVEAPNGVSLGEVKVGDTFADQIKFAIADGGTDFIIGDGFDVTVAAGDNKYYLAVYGAVNGLQTGAAILLQDADATSADVSDAVVLTHEAQISPSLLAYDASVSDDGKKTSVLAGLAANNVQVLDVA